MLYDYQTKQPFVFTEEGQKMLFSMSDKADAAIAAAGAVRMDKLMDGLCGSSWAMLACADRLVELGRLREINQVGYVPAQHRIFTKRGE